jgi:hypothetical protein
MCVYSGNHKRVCRFVSSCKRAFFAVKNIVGVPEPTYFDPNRISEKIIVGEKSYFGFPSKNKLKAVFRAYIRQ